MTILPFFFHILNFILSLLIFSLCIGTPWFQCLFGSILSFLTSSVLHYTNGSSLSFLVHGIFLVQVDLCPCPPWTHIFSSFVLFDPRILSLRGIRYTRIVRLSTPRRPLSFFLVLFDLWQSVGNSDTANEECLKFVPYLIVVSKE